MTVLELRDALTALIENGDVDPNAEVFMSQPTHDHWGNVKAESISHVEPFCCVQMSAYHSGWVIDDETSDTTEVVLR